MYITGQCNKTERLVMTALMIALVIIGTIVLRIPVPMTHGYVHLGEAMVYLSVLILGKKNGSFVAAAGSALADVFGGFAAFAPWTLLIKFGMAFAMGAILEFADRPHPQHAQGRSVNPLLVSVLAMTASGVLMCLGYFIAETIMYGNHIAALTEVPWNIGQFSAGIILAAAINASLKKALSGHL